MTVYRFTDREYFSFDGKRNKETGDILLQDVPVLSLTASAAALSDTLFFDNG